MVAPNPVNNAGPPQEIVNILRLRPQLVIRTLMACIPKELVIKHLDWGETYTD